MAAFWTLDLARMTGEPHTGPGQGTDRVYQAEIERRSAHGVGIIRLSDHHAEPRREVATNFEKVSGHLNDRAHDVDNHAVRPFISDDPIPRPAPESEASGGNDSAPSERLGCVRVTGRPLRHLPSAAFRSARAPTRTARSHVGFTTASCIFCTAQDEELAVAKQGAGNKPQGTLRAETPRETCFADSLPQALRLRRCRNR